MISLIRVATASAVFATSMPVNAETYYFRHRTELTDARPAGGITSGNDITAVFTGAVGYPFSKAIPVVTKDVAEWRLVSGQYQQGLSLDSSTGIISGTASGSLKPVNAFVIGLDAWGTRIAQANITFKFRDPVGTPQKFVAYGHTGKFFYQTIPTTVQVARWESLTALPDELSVSGAAISGIPAKEYSQDVAFRGFDYLDKEVAFAYGQLVVQDGPVLLNIADQIRHPSKPFEINPKLEHQLGATLYSLVSLDGRPGGLAFRPDTGQLRGSISTFSTSLRFQIRATDQDGSVGISNVFRLVTAKPNSEIYSLGDLHATVNEPYEMTIKGYELAGEQSWEMIIGELPEGLELDQDTGTISGTPVKEETQIGNIAVTTSAGGYAESGTFSFTVHPETVGVDFLAKHVRVGEQFQTDAPTVGANVTAPYSFSIADPEAIADGLVVDGANATVSGSVSTAGDASVAFSFLNGDGNSKTVMQPIFVYNPLTIAYADKPVLHRRTKGSILPSIPENSVIGTPEFSLASGTLPPGVTLSKSSGEIGGTPLQTGNWTGISIALKDASGATKSSNLFSITVAERPDVEVSTKDVQIERYVDNAAVLATASNVVDGVAFQISAGSLPSGISLRGDGVLLGMTTAPVGTFGGLRVKATDGDGFSGESAEFSIEVVPPQDLDPLVEAATNLRWTEKSSFSLELPIPSNAYGTMSYVVEGLPPGVNAMGTRIYGTVAEAGTYPFAVTMTDDAGRSLQSAMNLVILPPMTVAFSANSLSGTPAMFAKAAPANTNAFYLPRGGFAKVEAAVTNGIEPITYTYSGQAPTGMSFDGNSVSGYPGVEGEKTTPAITISDAAGTSISTMLSLNVVERLPIVIDYTVASPASAWRKAITPILPSVKNAIGKTTFSLSGQLPPGLKFNPDNGEISGRGSMDGRYGGLVVTASDEDGDDYAGTTEPFEIGISRSGSVGLATKTFYTVRAGKSFLKKLAVSNVTAPLAFSAAGMPDGVEMNLVDGTISGTIASEGVQKSSVGVTDTFGRSKQSTVEFKAVGQVGIAAPTTTAFTQFASVSAKPVSQNVIGLARYDLVAGTLPDGMTLNTVTGMITGVAEKKGTWPGIAIRVTDSMGESATTTPFAMSVTDRLPLQINAASSYPVFVNLPYKLTIPVSNPIGAVTYALSGTLPPGLQFDVKKGLISGTATALGNYVVSMTVADSVGGSATKSFTLAVQLNDKPIALTVTDFVTKVGHPIETKAPTWSNSVGDTTFRADDVLAENDLSINPVTGVISGQATSLMDITANIHISDPTGRLTSKPINIRVIPDTVINAPDVVDLVVNITMKSVVATASNTVGSSTWSLNGKLPTGVTFSTQYGSFSGTPTEIGSFPVTLTNQDSLEDVKSKAIRIVVANNGMPPSLALSMPSGGYSVATNYNPLALTHTNKKVGDVLSLAPGSAALPPGMTLTQDSSGAWRLQKSPVADSAIGVYRGVTLRATDVEGLFSDLGPMDFIYRPLTSLNYASISFTSRAMASVSLDPPTPSAGKKIEDVSFEFSTKAAGGQSLTIDPATGAISGYITASGTNVVKVTESYDGKVIRTFNYNVAFTKVDLSMALDDFTVLSDIEYKSDAVRMTNTIPSGGYTVIGQLPSGISFDPASLRFIGTTSEIGSFPVVLNYEDAHATISTPIKVHVSAPGEGHRFWRIAYRKGQDSGTTTFYEMDLIDANGGNLNALAAKTGIAALWDNDNATAQAIGNYNGADVQRYVTFEFPAAVQPKKGVVLAGSNVSANIFYQWSDDGTTWTQTGATITFRNGAALRETAL